MKRQHCSNFEIIDWDVSVQYDLYSLLSAFPSVVKCASEHFVINLQT